MSYAINAHYCRQYTDTPGGLKRIECDAGDFYATAGTWYGAEEAVAYHKAQLRDLYPGTGIGQGLGDAHLSPFQICAAETGDTLRRRIAELGVALRNITDAYDAKGRYLERAEARIAAVIALCDDPNECECPDGHLRRVRALCGDSSDAMGETK